jgi:hypothetical protein
VNRHGDVEHAIHQEDMVPLAAHLGALVGRAHRRGCTGERPKAWTVAELHGIVDRAIAIAGIHEATYLSVCRLERDLLQRG